MEHDRQDGPATATVEATTGGPSGTATAPARVGHEAAPAPARPNRWRRPLIALAIIGALGAGA